jgi:NAD+ synthetase
VRLPYGAQRDQQDAQLALQFVRPDESLTVNVQGPSDEMLRSLEQRGAQHVDDCQEDFVLGNIKARERMIAQYAIAGARRGLVIGSDHAAESLMGFFTKFGDGGADILPLWGLSKRRVRGLARSMGADQHLVMKDLRPIWRLSRRSDPTRTAMALLTKILTILWKERRSVTKYSRRCAGSTWQRATSDRFRSKCPAINTGNISLVFDSKHWSPGQGGPAHKAEA